MSTSDVFHRDPFDIATCSHWLGDTSHWDPSRSSTGRNCRLQRPKVWATPKWVRSTWKSRSNPFHPWRHIVHRASIGNSSYISSYPAPNLWYSAASWKGACFCSSYRISRQRRILREKRKKRAWTWKSVPKSFWIHELLLRLDHLLGESEETRVKAAKRVNQTKRDFILMGSGK